MWEPWTGPCLAELHRHCITTLSMMNES